MSKRLSATPAPGLLETFCAEFDPLFSKRNQRDTFRHYLAHLLLPNERNKTLTGRANPEPVVGAQHARAQHLQWFLSESTWDSKEVNQQRLTLLYDDLTTAPTATGYWLLMQLATVKPARKRHTSVASI